MDEGVDLAEQVRVTLFRELVRYLGSDEERLAKLC